MQPDEYKNGYHKGYKEVVEQGECFGIKWEFIHFTTPDFLDEGSHMIHIYTKNIPQDMIDKYFLEYDDESDSYYKDHWFVDVRKDKLMIMLKDIFHSQSWKSIKPKPSKPINSFVFKFKSEEFPPL